MGLCECVTQSSDVPADSECQAPIHEAAPTEDAVKLPSIARIVGEDTWVRRHTRLGRGELYLVAICIISSPASPWIAWWRVTASTSICTAGLLGCEASGANNRADTVVSSTAPLPSDSPRRSWRRPRGPRQACATAPSLRAQRRMSCTNCASRVTATRCCSIYGASCAQRRSRRERRIAPVCPRPARQPAAMQTVRSARP
jgi:hypothetical protein